MEQISRARWAILHTQTAHRDMIPVLAMFNSDTHQIPEDFKILRFMLAANQTILKKVEIESRCMIVPATPALEIVLCGGLESYPTLRSALIK